RWTQATKARLSSIVYACRGNTTSHNRRRCDTVSAGAFFPQTPLQVPEKKMGQHGEQHGVMPAGIFPHFILRHPQLRFPFLTTLFHRPADATQPDQGAQGRARWGITEISNSSPPVLIVTMIPFGCIALWANGRCPFPDVYRVIAQQVGAFPLFFACLSSLHL